MFLRSLLVCREPCLSHSPVLLVNLRAMRPSSPSFLGRAATHRRRLWSMCTLIPPPLRFRILHRSLEVQLQASSQLRLGRASAKFGEHLLHRPGGREIHRQAPVRCGQVGRHLRVQQRLGRVGVPVRNGPVQWRKACAQKSRAWPAVVAPRAASTLGCCGGRRGAFCLRGAPSESMSFVSIPWLISSWMTDTRAARFRVAA